GSCGNRKPRSGPLGPKGPSSPNGSADPDSSSAVLATETVPTWTTAGAAASTMPANEGSPRASVRVAGASGLAVGGAGGAAWAGSSRTRRPAAKPPAPRQAASAPANKRFFVVESIDVLLLWGYQRSDFGRRRWCRDVRIA